VRNENPRLANLAVLGSCVRGRGEHSLTPYNPITPGGLYVGLLGGSPNTQTSIEYGGTPVCPASNLGIFGETPAFRIMAVAPNAPGIYDVMIVVPTPPRKSELKWLLLSPVCCVERFLDRPGDTPTP